MFDISKNCIKVIEWPELIKDKPKDRIDLLFQYSNLNNSRIGTMSKSSLNIMKKIDFKKSAKHRLSNFKFFVKKLKKMQNIKGDPNILAAKSINELIVKN